MTEHKSLFGRLLMCLVTFLTVLATCHPAAAQDGTATKESSEESLARSVRELRSEVEELRTAVSEIRSEAAEYRAENEKLRTELESMRVDSRPREAAAAQVSSTSQGPSSPAEEQVKALQETTDLIESQVRTQYQTKVESASKYRVRLSGLVLLNLFHNRGPVDNLDVPTFAVATSTYGVTPAFGGTLRQSELGLEVFGPELAGAKTRGSIQFDFGGGFPVGAVDGINTGLVRLRTASGRLDWEHTSIIAGQDNLFVSPNTPASFASLLVPSFGYSGNLWAWTPQLRFEHRLDLSDGQSILVQGGILDNVTGEAAFDSHRLPQAGESSGQPAYAARAAWTMKPGTRPLTLGASGYYAPQNWGPGWSVNGWAAVADWRIPLIPRFELAGEFFRGRALGGLGGGIGQSVLFNGTPAQPTGFRPLNSAGGWSQLKFSATRRLEFNGGFGVDSPFASDIHALPAPFGVYQWVLTANRSEMMNFIYRPHSDLLVSGEYRHLRTTQVGAYYSADQLNLMMGVLF